MSKILRVDQLGDVGVNTDLPHSTLPSNAFTLGNNFHIRNNAIETFGGSKLISTPPEDFEGGSIHYYSEGNIRGFIISGSIKTYFFDGNTWRDITSLIPAGIIFADNANTLWTETQLGTIAVVNNRTIWPYYFKNSGVPNILVPLPFSSTQSFQQIDIRVNSIRAHKNFLFALNTVEQGTLFPNTYRWSAPADINGLPFTWDEFDLSSIAGKAELSGGGGSIIDGASIRDAFCIYSENSIDILDYIGGEFIWSVRGLSTTVGLASSNAIAPIYNANIFLSQDDIILNDGNSLTSILNKRLRRKLTSTINQDNIHVAYAFSNPRAKEVWVCYQEDGFTYANMAMVYDWANDKVSIRDMPVNTFNATVGPYITTAVTVPWDTATQLWSGIASTWRSVDSVRSSPEVVMAVATGSTIIAIVGPELGGDLGQDEVNQGGFFTLLERLSYSIESEETVVSVKSIYPKFDSGALVTIELGASEFHDGPITWQPQVIFDSSTMRKVDIRSTGKLHSWRIASYGTQSRGNPPFRLYGMDIEYEVNGAR